MDEILATHEPRPLSPEQEQAIDDVLREARDHYRTRGMISDEEWAEVQSAVSGTPPSSR
jgi:hypothetical protein